MKSCFKRAVCDKKCHGKKWKESIDILGNGPLKGIFVWGAWFYKTTHQCKLKLKKLCAIKIWLCPKYLMKLTNTSLIPPVHLVPGIAAFANHQTSPTPKE